ncbi:hypothetical protein [Pedobacter sp. WC2423]|uniref:hypothetical protein n=1 Tax=Pedobacter sp. WC2423 TaxID=3234142 RepID=UPI0034656BBA
MIHLYFEAPNISDWLTFIASFLTFCVSMATFIIGYRALNTWRNEKRHNTIVNALTISTRARNYIVALRSPAQMEGELDEKIVELYKDKNIPSEVLIIESRRKNFSDLLNNIYLNNEIVLIELGEQHIIHKFLQKVIDIENEVLIASDTYAKLKILIDKGQIEKQEVRSELIKLRKIMFQFQEDEQFSALSDLYEELITFRKSLSRA